MTDDLVAFLRARLDEDWKIAFESGDGGREAWHFNQALPWESASGPREAVVRFNGSALGYIAAVDPVHGKYGTWNARHIARWDPERVLAEVNAKRRIVDELGAVVGGDYIDDGEPVLAERVLRLLALPYASHEAYRSEWAPDA